MPRHFIAPLDRPSPQLLVSPLGIRSPIADAGVAWCAVRFADVGEAPTADASVESVFHVVVPPQLATAVPRRIATYLAGRYCAEQALAGAGHPAPIPPVGRAANGAPIWPTGWVGSIAHTDGECVAVCAHGGIMASLGVDCERIVSRKIASEIGDSVAPEVASGLAHIGLLDPMVALTLAFSAKEALYKALFAEVGSYFGFEAAELVAIDAHDATLELRLVSDLTAALRIGQRFTLHFAVGADVVVTSLALPRVDV